MPEFYSIPELAAGAYWKEIRFDYASGNLDYKGVHRQAGASTSDPDWQIVKFSWSSGNLVRKQGPRQGAWENRASLGW